MITHHSYSVPSFEEGWENLRLTLHNTIKALLGRTKVEKTVEFELELGWSKIVTYTLDPLSPLTTRCDLLA